MQEIDTVGAEFAIIFFVLALRLSKPKAAGIPLSDDRLSLVRVSFHFATDNPN